MKKLPPYQIAISPMDARVRLGRRLKAYEEYESQLEWEDYSFQRRLEKVKRICKKRVLNLDNFRAIFA